MLVLIADDEPIIRLGLGSMLEEMGHLVVTAANGREALQQAKRHRPDMAILDIKMPYTDGLQAAATLSRDQPMPILLLTAFSDKELIEQASDLPIQGYLVKPVKTGELAAAMSVAAKRFAESQRLQAQADKLEEKLETRILVDRAKGKLMATGMSEEAAYKTIQRQARDSQLSMRQVALMILQQKKP
jgi:AmiR/NasT family two-component response regulator